MDPAEAWLQTNDPDYPQSRQGWRHLNVEGEYEIPPEETPSGLQPEYARSWADDPQ